MGRTEQTNGYVHLYVGDGKGKTTAAVGLGVRALGRGWNVLFTQFLKGRPTGEIGPLETLGANVLRAKGCEKFVFQMTDEEREATARDHMEMLEQIRLAVTQGNTDLAVLDEVVDAVNAGIVPLDALTALIRTRRPEVELVLTGRNPPQELVSLCHYHTLFSSQAHPYSGGVPAREGVEF